MYQSPMTNGKKRHSAVVQNVDLLLASLMPDHKGALLILAKL